MMGFLFGRRSEVDELTDTARELIVTIKEAIDTIESTTRAQNRVSNRLVHAAHDRIEGNHDPLS